jgi:cob(I)alamin adenosyltransferase
MRARVKIYTRRGDRGETDLLGGARVGKDHPRVVAYGAVDELNAQLGVAAAASRHDDLRSLVRQLQGELFELGALLASPEPALRAKSGIAEPSPEQVAFLEGRIDALEGELEPLRRFVLPGGHDAAAAFHVARTVCRRAEREVVALDRAEPLGATVLTWLNRLSDLLFVLARVENRRAGLADVEWSPRR